MQTDLHEYKTTLKDLKTEAIKRSVNNTQNIPPMKTYIANVRSLTTGKYATRLMNFNF